MDEATVGNVTESIENAIRHSVKIQPWMYYVNLQATEFPYTSNCLRKSIY